MTAYTPYNRRMTQRELESYLWGAAVLLRGLIDAGDYKQFIFPLLFFKRISDVWDEEYQRALDESDGDLEYAAFAENHRFELPDSAHWRDVRAVATDVELLSLARSSEGLHAAAFELRCDAWDVGEMVALLRRFVPSARLVVAEAAEGEHGAVSASVPPGRAIRGGPAASEEVQRIV